MGAALSLKLNIKEELGMKKLEIIIKPEKLEDLKGVLDTEEVNGLNIVNSMGYGNQKGIIKNYRGCRVFRESASEDQSRDGCGRRSCTEAD